MQEGRAWRSGRCGEGPAGGGGGELSGSFNEGKSGVGTEDEHALAADAPIVFIFVSVPDWAEDLMVFFDRRGAVENDGLVGMLGSDGAVGVSDEVAGLDGLAGGAEVEGAAEPHGPDGHRVRAAVGSGGGDPEVARLLETFDSQAPGEQALAAFGDAVTGHVRPGGDRLGAHRGLTHRIFLSS